MKIITKLILPLAMAVSMVCSVARAQEPTVSPAEAVILDLQGDIVAMEVTSHPKVAARLRRDLGRTLDKAAHYLDRGQIEQTAKEIVIFARQMKAAGRRGLIDPAVVDHLVGDDCIELLKILIELEEPSNP